MYIQSNNKHQCNVVSPFYCMYAGQTTKNNGVGQTIAILMWSCLKVDLHQ